MYLKLFCGWPGSAGLTEGTYSAPPVPLARFEAATLRQRRRGEGIRAGRGRSKGRKREGREGREGHKGRRKEDYSPPHL